LKNCWHGWPGIEPTTIDLCFQSGAYNLSAMATSDNKISLQGHLKNKAIESALPKVMIILMQIIINSKRQASW